MPGGSKPGGGLKVTPYKMKNSALHKGAKYGSPIHANYSSPMKHEPWAKKHKQRSAHSATAEAHGVQPTYGGEKGKEVPGGGAANRPENQA
tara:strand:+ start:282 stop:554 length:273 start_codon:yes stop_codon:yes gene_type:complete